MRRFFIASAGALGVVILSCLATLWAMGQVSVLYCDYIEVD